MINVKCIGRACRPYFVENEICFFLSHNIQIVCHYLSMEKTWNICDPNPWKYETGNHALHNPGHFYPVLAWWGLQIKTRCPRWIGQTREVIVQLAWSDSLTCKQICAYHWSKCQTDWSGISIICWWHTPMHAYICLPRSWWICVRQYKSNLHSP